MFGLQKPVDYLPTEFWYATFCAVSYTHLDVYKRQVMDSVDARAAEEWLSNVARVLEGRSPDYLVAVSYTHLVCPLTELQLYARHHLLSCGAQ